MMILLDANILAYTINRAAAQHEPSFAVVDAAFENRIPGILVPQVLMEFLAVTTNPKRVARALDLATAWRQVETLRRGIPLLDLRSDALDILGELLQTYPRTGSRIYDLFLAAQMQTHGISQICTYNVSDFAGLPDIEPLTPKQVLATLS